MSKGRAANGDRPVGAARCRREQHTMATYQKPHPCLLSPKPVPIGGSFFFSGSRWCPPCNPPPPPRGGDRHFTVLLRNIYCRHLFPTVTHTFLHCFPITSNQSPACILRYSLSKGGVQGVQEQSQPPNRLVRLRNRPLKRLPDKKKQPHAPVPPPH